MIHIMYRGVQVISAKQAAEATGATKQAIIRAFKRGTIRASNNIHGGWTIDAAELFRHYQPLSVVNTDSNSSDADVHPLTPSPLIPFARKS
jgi:hypothetical protein